MEDITDNTAGIDEIIYELIESKAPIVKHPIILHTISVCPFCDGSGYITIPSEGTSCKSTIKCENCNGKGIINGRL